VPTQEWSPPPQLPPRAHTSMWRVFHRALYTVPKPPLPICSRTSRSLQLTVHWELAEQGQTTADNEEPSVPLAIAVRDSGKQDQVGGGRAT
jgi:hypothetical protein